MKNKLGAMIILEFDDGTYYTVSFDDDRGEFADRIANRKITGLRAQANEVKVVSTFKEYKTR